VLRLEDGYRGGTMDKIVVDSRVGSRELMRWFSPGVAELGRLEYGDFMFSGRGKGKEPWLVGVERKTIRDLLNSIASGRFAGHQLLGLLNSYNVVYLVVEGLVRPNPGTGVLEIRRNRQWVVLELGKRRFMMRDVWEWVNTVTLMTGVVVFMTSRECETAKLVTALHRWWNIKDWEEHRAHVSPRVSTVPGLVRPSVLKMVAAQLPGVGWERAGKVEVYFESVADMAEAGVEDWEAIPGIGPKTAEKAWRAIHGDSMCRRMRN